MSLLTDSDLMTCIAEGFIAYSQGQALIPPVAGMEFESPPGDIHIKYGYITDQPYYVIKIASGFYDNPRIGKPSSNGVMLLFSRQTGELEAILHDEGYLTDVRTAVAGALAARLLAPEDVHCIGIVGTGTQARLQLAYLRTVTSCRNVMVYGRSERGRTAFQSDLQRKGFNVQVCSALPELAKRCNLIVTTTTAKEPLLSADDILPGTHITAVGADTPGKQELDTRIFSRASLVVADSKLQCLERGECANAVRKGDLQPESVLELGYLLGQDRPVRHQTDITVADLTGVAVQDIQIATAIYQNSKEYSA
ncbi:TPA: ornithine cyclodeaminase family protein [Pseudomonas aeruginosa]|nr:ornithine cyclodeaminase family protein [Pseudomonas aeruginosa]